MRQTMNGLEVGRRIHVRGQGKFGFGKFLRERPDKPGYIEYRCDYNSSIRLAQLQDVKTIVGPRIEKESSNK